MVCEKTDTRCLMQIIDKYENKKKGCEKLMKNVKN